MVLKKSCIFRGFTNVKRKFDPKKEKNIRIIPPEPKLGNIYDLLEAELGEKPNEEFPDNIENTQPSGFLKRKNGTEVVDNLLMENYMNLSTFSRKSVWEVYFLVLIIYEKVG